MLESDPYSITQEGSDDVGHIKAGSYTRLSTFESCNYHAQLSYIDKIPEPERPLPPGKTEHANDRGTRLHDSAEKFIKGGVELIPELTKFKAEFEKARELYAAGKASTEGDWAYTKEWEPVAWMSNDVWLRVKLDLCVHMTKDYAIAVDYKSGRRFGNEIKHSEQMQLYTVSTFIRFPKLKKMTTELWYLDQDELATMTYTREQGLRFLANFERRVNTMVDCEEFKASPNPFSCRWCPYRPVAKGGSGYCKFGI